MKFTTESSQNLLCEISIQIREKRLSPRRAPRRSLLPLSPKRTQVRLKSLLYLVWLRQIHSEPTGVLRCKSAVCGLNGLLPTLRVGSLHLNPQPRAALLLLRPLSVGRFASLRFRPKNMAHHIFQLETELQNIPEAAPSSRSFSVSEKLARYGSSALSGVEHLRLLVGKDSILSLELRTDKSVTFVHRSSP